MFAAVRRFFSPDPKKALLEVLQDTPMPTFRPAVVEILRLLRDPNASNRVVGDAVSADPGLSLKLLRIVNSSAFGLRRKVEDVGHASALLGRSTLEELTLGAAVAEVLPNDAPGFDSRLFWRTAARRAATGRQLAERVDPSRRGICFTAGLLQDLAIPLLAMTYAKHPGLVLAARNADASLVEAERAEFGWCHAEVAGWLCHAWDFPDPLRLAITGHHGDAEAPAVVQLVALLEDDQSSADRLVEVAQDTFGLDPDDVLAALDEGAERGDELARSFT